MKSVTTARFRKAYNILPKRIKEAAKKSFRLWTRSPNHPSLQFKSIHKTKPIYSVRIGLSWRALGTKEEDTIIWFWIGSHADYDNLISYL